MKKYVLYNWHADNDECGIGICYAKDFTTNIGYYGGSGWNRCPSHFITGFDTVDEAVKYLHSIYNFSADDMEEVEADIIYRLFLFHHNRGEYEEAQKLIEC